MPKCHVKNRCHAKWMPAKSAQAGWDGSMNWIEPFSTGNRRESMNGFGQSMAVMPDKKGAAEVQ
jgi:hypothetical protein